MAPSTMRKAIGAMKDQTSISIAKVAGNVASDLEILIVKATSHEAEPANEKHVAEILNITDSTRGNVKVCLMAISKRLSKSRDWIVVLKCLILLHRLLIEGNCAFQDEIIEFNRRGSRLFNLIGFRDEAHSNSWDHSGFVKSYALYLNQMVEFQVYERISSRDYGSEDGGRLSAPCFEESHYRLQVKSKSWNDGDEVGRRRIELNPNPERVLDRTITLQRLLGRFLSCRPTASAQSSRMILIALYPMVKESFRLYSDVRETTTMLLDKFRDLDSAKAFDVYLSVSKQIDELVRFYDWCKEAGVARASEYPVVRKLDERMIEEFLKERDGRIENAQINAEKNIEDDLVVSTPVSKLELEVADLLNLDEEEADEVALAFSSASFPAIGSPEKTTGEDWEAVLVESASRFYGGSIVVAEEGAGGGFGSPLVDEAGRDPFAASLTVPPPAYVQHADMEKRQTRVPEHQQWRPLGGQWSPAGLNYHGSEFPMAATRHGIWQPDGSYGSRF